MSITFSTRAQENLFEIIDYYETHVNEEFANTIEENIKQQISHINGFERSIPESDIYPGMRKLVISKLPYIAYIREKGDKSGWEVIDIVHTSRKFPK